MSVKQVLVVRKDLNMRKGKLGAQCAHASMKVVLDLCTRTETYTGPDGHLVTHEYKFTAVGPLMKWLADDKSKKIVVSVNSEEELLAVYEAAKEANILSSLVTDLGLTEFGGVPTNTVVAIGPDFDEKIDQITGKLNLI